ncbi:MAG: MucBP domain-containing protein [Lactobacillus sp.]|nr:MucBP domain-containing protein [Lactobacillus sp.]
MKKILITALLIIGNIITVFQPQLVFAKQNEGTNLKQNSFASALNEIWHNDIKLINTPAKEAKQIPLFQETIDERALSAEDKEKASEIADIIRQTTYEDLLSLYYDDPSEAYSDLTDTQVISFTREQNSDPNFLYDRVQLKDSFQEIQEQANQFALHFIRAFPSSSVESFSSSKKEYLIVASYIHRWFDIYSEKSQKDLWEVMYFEGTDLFSEEDSNGWDESNLLTVAKELEGNESQGYPDQYTFGLMTGKRIESQFVFVATPYLTIYTDGKKVSYQTYVEQFLQKYEQTGDYDTWFKNYFGGYLYEDTSVPEEYQESMWAKLPKKLLPYYLTVKNSQNLILFNTMKYIVLTDKISNPNYGIGLAHASMTMNQYFQTVIRTMDQGKEKVDNFLDSAIYDNGLNSEGKAEFTNKENALNYDIYSPAGDLVPLSDRYMNAMTEIGNYDSVVSGNIFYGMYNKIDYLDQFTLGHELTHALYPYIGNPSDEFTSAYMEGGYGDLPANNMYDTSGSVGAGFANSTPLRFQNKTDLKEYNNRYDQLIDVLNAALAEAVLKQPASELTSYLGKATIDSSGALKDIVSLSKEEIQKLNLKTYQDLIDNNIVIKSPGETNFSTDYTLSQSQYFLHLESQRLFNKLFGIDGWEGLRKFKDTKEDSKDLDTSLCAAYQEDKLTSKQLLSRDMNTAVEKLKSEDTVVGNFDEIKAAFSKDLSNLETIKKNFIQQALKTTNEFRSDIYQPKEPVKAQDVIVRYQDEQKSEIHASQIISGNIGDKYDASTDQYKLKIEGYSLDETNLPENEKGTLSDKPQTVIYNYKKDIVPTASIITPDPYEVGTSTITGKYTGEVQGAHLFVNGKEISRGGTFKDGEFSYYCRIGAIKEGDKAILKAYDKQSNIVDTKEITVQVPSIGKLSDVNYDMGASTITGKYQGKVKKAKLIINNKVISWGGTFKDGVLSYYVKPSLIHQADNVSLQPYGEDDSHGGEAVTVHLSEPSGGFISASRALGSTMIKGTYTGDIYQAKLFVNGKEISKGGMFSDKDFEYYVGNRTFKDTDQVLLKGMDKYGNPIQGAEIKVTNEKASVVIKNLQYTRGTKELTGNYEDGEIKQGQLFINGKSTSWGGTFNKGKINYYVNPNQVKKESHLTMNFYDTKGKIVSFQQKVEID